MPLKEFIVTVCTITGLWLNHGDGLWGEYEIGDIPLQMHTAPADTLKPPKANREVITFKEIKDSLALFRKHNNRARLSQSYERLGDLYIEKNQAAALAHYLMAADHYRQLNNTPKVIEMYHTVSVLYRRHEHFGEALAYAKRARELSEQIADDSLIAISAFHLGRVYQRTGDHEKAMNLYDTALNRFKKYDRSSEAATMYYHMAEAKEALGQSNEALKLHQKAVDIHQERNDSVRLADSFYQIGMALAAQDDLTMALDYHQRSADVTNKINYPIREAQNYIQIGRIKSKQNDPADAINYAKRALQIANKFNALEIKVDALRLAIGAHATLGNLSRIGSLQEELASLQDSLEKLKQQQQQQNLSFHVQAVEKLDSLKQLQKAHAEQGEKLEREHFLLIISIIVGLALIVILILLYSRYQYRKKQEDLLLNKNKELETLNNRLESLNEEKNEILQTVTHDMKNMLTGIIGLADLSIMDSETIERKQLLEFMRQIKQQAYNINTMIEKLLDVRTLESGGYNLQIEEENIIEMLDEVVMNNQQRAEDKDLEIIKSFEVGNGEVLADQMATQRVLDNLVSNAIKYSPKGKKIYLDAHPDNGHIRVEVMDEGPGIKSDEQDKLFSKFGRLSSKPTDGEHSTGLGVCRTFRS